MEQLRSAQSLAVGEFALSDAFYFCEKGLESIVDDQVTQRFSSEELASWNLLTRTNQNFRYISLRLTVIWVVGVFVRYGVLFPLRSVRVGAASHQIGSFNIAALTSSSRLTSPGGFVPLNNLPGDEFLVDLLVFLFHCAKCLEIPREVDLVL